MDSVRNRNVSRVLLAEDEPLIRMVLADALADAGFQVVEAGSGDEAAALCQDGERFDLLVTDVQMPGRLDGLRLAGVVRTLWPDIPVVFLTGRPEVLDDPARLRSRQAYVLKPFGLDEMLDAVRGVMARPPPG